MTKNESFNADLSALYDGELERHECGTVIESAMRDSAARTAWQTYALIGDHLRQRGMGSADMTAAVMARLQEEPVVLAPRNLKLNNQRHPLWALAASVAGVAVVGWLALADASHSENRLATVSSAPTFTQTAQTIGVPASSADASAARRDMHEYLIAHHTQAATFRLGDSTEQVRPMAIGSKLNRP